MTQKRNLLSAATLLSSQTNNPHIKDDVLGIIGAGAEGLLPVYWLKPKFLTTTLSNFTNDWKHTDPLCDWLQIQPHDLHELARAVQTDVINFELSLEDRKFLAKTPQPIQLPAKEGEYVSVPEPGFRHANHKPVTVHRDQLFVFESDLMAYAATREDTPGTTAPETVETVCEIKKQPEPLTTREIYSCFAGFHGWDADKWKANLGKPSPWLKACLKKKGNQGKPFVQSTWWPIDIAVALDKKEKNIRRALHARFKNSEPLKPWLETLENNLPDDSGT